MSTARIIIAAFAVCTFTNCSKKHEPEKESKEGLQQALKGVEQAEEGFKRMREKGEALQVKIDEQTKLLDSTIAKQNRVLAERVAADEKVILSLSPEKQAGLLSALTDLKQQMEKLEATLREYRDAPAGKLDERQRTEVEKVAVDLSQLEAKVREAILSQ